MWFALPWLAVAFPLLTALRLRGEFSGDDDLLEAGSLYVAYVGPLFAFCGLWFGLRGAGSVQDILDRGGRPFAALLATTAGGLLLLMPFDLTLLDGPWRWQLTWIAAGGLPCWSATLLLRTRGFSRNTAGLGGIAMAALLALLGVILGVELYLDPPALLLPVATAGLVASLGLVLSAWETVTAPTGPILLASGLLASLIAAATAWPVAHPPEASASVAWLDTVDPVSNRAVVGVVWPNVSGHRMVEVDLGTGEARPLPRSVDIVRYAAGVRVTSRRGSLGKALGREGATSLCMEREGVEVCRSVFPPGRNVILDAHPTLPRVVASRGPRLLVWDVRDDVSWQVDRPGEWIRWPCFDEEGGVIWRVPGGEGPYRHERLVLRPGAEGEALEFEHQHACLGGDGGHPGVRFVRLRSRLKRPSLLFAEGLPAEGLPVPDPVVQTDWSGRGDLAVFLVDDPGPGMAMWFWRAGDTQLTGPMDSFNAPEVLLDRDGALVASPLSGGRGAWSFVVRALPGGETVDEGPIDGAPVRWDSDGRALVFVQGGRLVRRDPRSRETTVLYPPL